MTKANLNRRSALSSAALAVLLAASLSGCSSSTEDAEETPEVTTQEETVEVVEEPEPESEEPAVDESQLIASVAQYYENNDNAVYTATLSYDDEGRLISQDSSFYTSKKWTYDEEGNLLTEEESYTEEDGELITSLKTYSYNSEGLPEKRTYETNEPDRYYDPVTGEEIEDPSQGILMEFDSPLTTYEWSSDGLTETITSYNRANEITDKSVDTLKSKPELPVFRVSLDAEHLGEMDETIELLSSDSMNSDGTITSTTTNEYNDEGKIIKSMWGAEGETYSTWTYEYDNAGNEVLFKAESDDSYSITESKYTDGKITQRIENDSHSGIAVSIFTYDSTGRLKAIAHAWPNYNDDLEPTGEYLCTCSVYDYVADNEELSSTPEELMAEARSQIEATA